jgi:TRAP transporter TAXI family solute receptor
MRVSIGSASSGVRVIAGPLLQAAGMASSDIKSVELGLDESADALRQGTIDAFFWSGGLPTSGISTLAKTVHLRLVDLSGVLPALREHHEVYGTASVPVSTYGLPSPPVTTLVVRNFLLVTAAMRDDVAEALVRGMFEAQPRLVSASLAASAIDPRSAIETVPVPLHPGAERYYRADKV